MSLIEKTVSLFLTLAIIACVPLRAEAQASTEFRDALRGVTFYSVVVSTDAQVDLQVEGSRFANSDRMTLGLSALFFDESDDVDDYVLWLRHDGPRRWFTGPTEPPLRLIIDDKSTQLTPLHALRPGDAGTAGQFVEKLEFSLGPAKFEELLGAESVTMELTTLLGLVEKRLNKNELEVIRRFHESVLDRHDEAKSDFALISQAVKGG